MSTATFDLSQVAVWGSMTTTNTNDSFVVGGFRSLESSETYVAFKFTGTMAELLAYEYAGQADALESTLDGVTTTLTATATGQIPFDYQVVASTSETLHQLVLRDRYGTNACLPSNVGTVRITGASPSIALPMRAGAAGDKFVVFVGDSRIKGTDATSPGRTTGGGSVPAQVCALIPGLLAANNGIASETGRNLLARAAMDVDTQYNPARDANVCVYAPGHNDLSAGYSVDSIVADTWAFCDGRRAAGFRVAVVTVFASAILTQSTVDAYNAAIRAGWTAHADGLIDAASDARLSDPSNTTYFAGNGVHLIDAGNAVYASIASPVVSALLAPPAPTVAPAITAQTPTTVTLAANASAGTVAWSVTAKPSGATVSPSTSTGATQVFQVDKAGDYTFAVVATASGVDSTPGTVTKTFGAALATITVSPSSVTIGQAGTQQFAASGVDQFGQPFAFTPTWTKTGSATINTTGLATAGALGNTTITATSGGVTGTATLTVADITAPTVGPLTLGSSGTSITGAMSEAGCVASSASGWTIAGRTVTAASISGTTLTLTLSAAILAGADFAISYTAGAIHDAAGNNLASFSGTVANGSTQQPASTWPADGDVRAGVTFQIAGTMHTGTYAGGGLTSEQAAQLSAAATNALAAKEAAEATTASNTTLAGAIADLATEVGQGGGGSNLGPGASPNVLRALIGATPVADADAWVTSDAGGVHVVAGTLQTRSDGRVTFMLDAGVTYYFWAQKDGVNAIQGVGFEAQ